MRIDRRQALGLLGAGVGTSGCATAAPTYFDGAADFAHGVASGDPTSTSVVLWTRLTLADPSAGSPVRLFLDATALRPDGTLDSETRVDLECAADPSRDWTVKVEVAGLRPGREYEYAFRAPAREDLVSPIGRFRTLPAEGSTDEVVLAVASCSLHPGGCFNAYEAIAGLERVDAVVHLGDYIYEYGAAPSDYGMRTGLELGRIPEPAHEIVTLADYRLRHAQYKADPQLQAAHARAAWIMTFDDHEVTNDPWEGGAENHDSGEGSWAARKAAALQAYLEWNPIRDPAPGTPLHEAVRRSFRFGRTAELHMVETRLSARSLQFEYEDITREDGSIDRDRLHDPERWLMGQAQLDWLGEAMTNDAAWQVLGNQVLMARLVVPNLIDAVGSEAIEAAMPGLADYQQRRLREMVALGGAAAPLNLDAWDGYPIERLRLYHKVREANGRLVVLSGDSHAAWASNLHDGEGLIMGVEFGATAVSSPQPSYSRALPGAPMAQMVVDASPDLEWCEFEPRGFFVLSLTPERVECRMIGLSTILESTFETSERARFTTAALAAGTVGPLTRI